MPKSLAAGMTTTFFASAALGRLVSIVCARYVKIHVLLFTELGACVLIYTLMALMALKSEVSVHYSYHFICLTSKILLVRLAMINSLVDRICLVTRFPGLRICVQKNPILLRSMPLTIAEHLPPVCSLISGC